MQLRTLAFFLVPVMTVAVTTAACDDKSDDDDDDDDDGGRGNCGGGSGPWGGGGRDCDSGWWGDSGHWSWDSGDWHGDSGDHADDERVESCDLDGLGLCFEVRNGSDISAWCDSVAAANGIDTTYSDDDCRSGAVLECDLTGVSSGDFREVSEADRVTAWYYPDFPADPWDSCASIGGS